MSKQKRISPQDFLLQYLHELDAVMKDNAIRMGVNRTLYGFIFKYGWFYKPCRLPKKYEFGKLHGCFDNAFDLMLNHKILTYCEGFAIAKGATDAIEHAWVTDGTGRAIDPTWPMGGVAYAGVPLQKMYVVSTTVRNMPAEGFIDDGKNNYPLLRELGDKPKEWLEETGKGIIKLK